MRSTPREVEVYEDDDGRAPYDEWLDALRDRKARSTIQTRIDRLEAGNFGDVRPVGAGVSELRVDFGPGYRVYLAEDGPKIVLLLLGGDKSSQRKDIRTATKLWTNYKEGKK